MMFVSCRSSLRPLLVLTACGLFAAGCFAAPVTYLEDKGEGDYNVAGSFTVKSPAALQAVLDFAVQDKTNDRYVLTISGGKVAFTKVLRGKTYPLGLTVPLPLKAGTTVPFTLQRRAWRLAFIWDNTVILRAFDRSLGTGKVGSKAAGGTWDDLRIQPVGDMKAQDDFVREEGAASIWEPAVGTWEAKTLRDDEQAAREEPDKSANAFSYFGSGLPCGITLAGNWFWDSYSFESAVKPLGRGAIGLVFYYQDDQNYLVLRSNCNADPAPNGDRLQLLAVRNGKSYVLGDKPGGYEPGQWYKLRVQVCDDVIQCFVDDELRLQTATRALGQGQVGLYVEGKTGAFFDDVACAEWDYFREDFTAVVAGKWTTGAGFKQADGAMTHAGAKSLCLTGEDWQRYICSVDATASAGATAGLVVCYKSPQDYCALEFTGTKALLIQVTSKGQTVLAEKPFTANGTQRRLRVSVEDGLLTGGVGDQLTLQALVPGLTGGAIGLLADDKVSFDNLTLVLLAPRRGSHVTKEFTFSDKHPEMEKWASTRGAWVPPAEGSDDWWSKGDYFGDTTVAFTVPTVGAKTGAVRAIIGGEPGSKVGLLLTVAAKEKSQQLTLTLAVGDKPLKTATVDVEGDAHLVFSRESSLIVVKVNEKTALTASR